VYFVASAAVGEEEGMKCVVSAWSRESGDDILKSWYERGLRRELVVGVDEIYKFKQTGGMR